MTEVEEEAALFAESEKRLAAERDAWLKKWPGHCTRCRGFGGFEWTEHHAAHFGERMFEPCAERAEGTCHRCGRAGAFVETYPFMDIPACGFCGWDHGKGVDDVMPGHTGW
jgi:hypothetical protein